MSPPALKCTSKNASKQDSKRLVARMSDAHAYKVTIKHMHRRYKTQKSTKHEHVPQATKHEWRKCG